MASPSIDITLTPEVPDGAATGVTVSYVVRGIDVAEGDTLCRIPKTLFGFPAAEITDDGIVAFDDGGELPLTHSLDEPTPTFTYRRWRTGRPSTGDIRVEYFAPVRVVTPATTNGPLYDLRAEGSGISAAGISFLALPDREEEFTSSVGWDLSQLPAGARGVSSHGEDTVSRTATPEALTFTFYMAGSIGSYPEHPDPVFGMYWLSQPQFDTTEVGAYVRELYDRMSVFFREPDPGYRVFVRKHPFPGNGGSAMPGSRSFMFGWSDEQPQSAPVLKNLLSHEAVHNWPLLSGDPAENSWYNEGVAEYYSLKLTLDAGILTADAFAGLLNERAHGYYSNPLQTLSSAETAELFWKDWRAQRVPYGRGLFYLIDVDHKLRATSEGQRGLDDLVLELLERRRAGEEASVAVWIDLVVRELGESAREKYGAMMAGRWVLPDTDALAPRLTGRDADIRQLDVGFDYPSFKSGTVTGVFEGGPADKAGVRDGDVIVHGPAPHSLPQKEVTEITLTLRRDDKTFDVTYEPLGELVPGRLWDAAD
ncbi:hypothetical protein [Streptomyces sp. NPDC003247]|uniref:hypothetical protein n=1 Tax=Streptomyces sp. NPDC003247 TaxID=3364677 RepID=UPI0036BA55B6